QQPTTGSSKIDILFMVDNSGSMAEEHANVAANAGAFIDLIAATPADFRIALVTTDMFNGPPKPGGGRFWSCSTTIRGCENFPCPAAGNPKILDRNTPNLKDVFAANVCSLGTGGDGFEKGLAAVEAALTPPLIDNENSGFLRNDALLGVVYVSDEEDCSR